MTRLRQLFQSKTDEVSPLVTRALSETVAWCSLQHSQSFLFRSSDIDPSFGLKIRPFPNEKVQIKVWIQEKYRSYERAVSELNQKRSDLIRAMSVPPFEGNNGDHLTGKLLLYFPMETVSDGAAEESSRGFLDGEDAPPWDTWFWYSKGAILCWIPELKIAAVQAGIDANPVDCVHWADWRDLTRLTT